MISVSLLYNVGAVDARALAAVGIVLLVAALLASYMPARRATKIDPLGAPAGITGREKAAAHPRS